MFLLYISIKINYRSSVLGRNLKNKKYFRAKTYRTFFVFLWLLEEKEKENQSTSKNAKVRAKEQEEEKESRRRRSRMSKSYGRSYGRSLYVEGVVEFPSKIRGISNP